MFQNNYRGGGQVRKLNVLIYEKKFKKGRGNDLSKGIRTRGCWWPGSKSDNYTKQCCNGMARAVKKKKVTPPAFNKLPC